jgi:hypothetical protein
MLPAAGCLQRATSGTLLPVTRLTRRQALLAGVVPLLGAVAGCDTSNGDQGPAQTATTTGAQSPGRTATTTAPGGRVRSGLVAFGDFGGGPAQSAVAAAMERWAARHRVDALVTTGDNVYNDGDPALFAAQLDRPTSACGAAGRCG